MTILAPRQPCDAQQPAPRNEYDRLLDLVRQDGDWEAWITFFLDGVTETANGAVETARRLTNLFDADHEKIQAKGRKASSALRIHEALKRRPVTTLQDLAKKTGLSFPTASASMTVLRDLGIAREVTGKRRNRVFAYGHFLDALNEGAEAL